MTVHRPQYSTVTLTCPTCGLRENYSVGLPWRADRTCPACGNPVPDNAPDDNAAPGWFCPQCGAHWWEGRDCSHRPADVPLYQH